MGKFETVAIPFQLSGNRRYLSAKQVYEHQFVADFVATFRHCFEQDFVRDLMWFIEPESAPPERLPPLEE